MSVTGAVKSLPHRRRGLHFRSAGLGLGLSSRLALGLWLVLNRHPKGLCCFHVGPYYPGHALEALHGRWPSRLRLGLWLVGYRYSKILHPLHYASATFCCKRVQSHQCVVLFHRIFRQHLQILLGLPVRSIQVGRKGGIQW
eukprot:1186583-Prorocentrum_minimum.AAC.2